MRIEDMIKQGRSAIKMHGVGLEALPTVCEKNDALIQAAIHDIAEQAYFLGVSDAIEELRRQIKEFARGEQ